MSASSMPWLSRMRRRKAPENSVPVWISRPQFEYWRYTHITVDVVPGRGAGFSLEAPEGVRFVIRSRMLTEAELAVLDG